MQLSLNIKAFIFFTSWHTIGFNNHLKRLGRTRLGVLIRPLWLWHHFHLVYWWRRGSNPRLFREPYPIPTRPQLSLNVIRFLNVTCYCDQSKIPEHPNYISKKRAVVTSLNQLRRQHVLTTLLVRSNVRNSFSKNRNPGSINHG